MANYLQMHKKQQVLALLELGWSYRRIQRETGVRRETVGDYDAGRHANPAKTFAGSDPAPPGDPATIEGEGAANPAKPSAPASTTSTARAASTRSSTISNNKSASASGTTSSVSISLREMISSSTPRASEFVRLPPLGGEGPNEHGQPEVARAQCGSWSRSESGRGMLQ